MKNITKKTFDFEAVEKRVAAEYPEKEYAGVYETVLHLKGVVEYLLSPEGKEAAIGELGELKYEMQLDLHRKSLETRERELRFLRKFLCR